MGGQNNNFNLLKIILLLFRELFCSNKRKIIYEFTKILFVSETYRRPIKDLLDTQWRPIGDRHFGLVDPSETNMFDRRPTSDMLHRRLTFHIGDQHAWSKTNRETDMPNRRPIRHSRSSMSVSNQACRSPIRHANQTCQSWMRLRCVTYRSPIVIIFSWTHNLRQNVKCM